MHDEPLSRPDTLGGTVRLQGVGWALSCCHGCAVFSNAPLHPDIPMTLLHRLCFANALENCLVEEGGLLVNVVCS